MWIRRLAVTLGATVLGAALICAPATPAAALNAASLNATIALSNCSASLVRFPTSLSTDRALMLTNGHCYEGGMPGAGVVLQNKASTRSGTLLSSTGANLGTVRADMLLYATMTNTDVSLYRLNTTYASIQSSFGVTALTIANTHPVDGSSVFIPSGYFKQIWNCSINGFVGTLREDVWTWHDSVRYNTGCNPIHGTSGSPIVDLASGQLVGINNTGNDDGAMCTLDNPCEVDPDGTTHATQGQSYGQETYWFNTCLNATNGLDLNKAGCLLPGGTPAGNTVTVTNPGSKTATVGTPFSLQIQATDSASGQTLTYSATGLPAGLAINTATGLISGTPTTVHDGQRHGDGEGHHQRDRHGDASPSPSGRPPAPAAATSSATPASRPAPPHRGRPVPAWSTTAPARRRTPARGRRGWTATAARTPTPCRSRSRSPPAATRRWPTGCTSTPRRPRPRPSSTS